MCFNSKQAQTPDPSVSDTSESETSGSTVCRVHLYADGRIPAHVKHPKGPYADLPAGDFVEGLVDLWSQQSITRIRRIKHLEFRYYYLPHGDLGDALRYLLLPGLKRLTLIGVTLTHSSLLKFIQKHPNVKVETIDVQYTSR